MEDSSDGLLWKCSNVIKVMRSRLLKELAKAAR